MNFFPESFRKFQEAHVVQGKIVDVADFLKKNKSATDNFVKAIERSADCDGDLLKVLQFLWANDSAQLASPGSNQILAALKPLKEAFDHVSGIRGFFQHSVRSEFATQFAHQMTAMILEKLSGPMKSGLTSLFERAGAPEKVVEALTQLNEATEAIEKVMPKMQAWTHEDKTNAVNFAFNGSMDGSKLQEFRQAAALAKREFVSEAVEKGMSESGTSAAFALALRSSIFKKLQHHEYAGLLTDACIADGDGSNDVFLNSARRTIMEQQAAKANRFQPIVHPNVWRRDTTNSIPGPGTKIVQHGDTALQKLPETPVAWEKFIPPTQRFEVAQYSSVIREMVEKISEESSKQDRSRRIVFNVEDLPPFLSSIPQRRLKAAEKEGVKATAWLIAELRHQGFEVVVFQHGQRKRFWEKVSERLVERYPDRDMTLVREVRTSDMILELPGLNPRNR